MEVLGPSSLEITEALFENKLELNFFCLIFRKKHAFMTQRTML